MASIFPSRSASSSSVSSPSATTVPFASIRSRKPPLPVHPPRYNPPITSIDSYFRAVAVNIGLRTPSPLTILEPRDCLTLTLHDVPLTALSYVQRRLDYLASGPVSCAKSGKLDYNLATKTLIISSASSAHDIMSRIDNELLNPINANDRQFYGTVYRDNPAMQIVPAGSTEIPIAFAPGLTRRPDGSLRLLGRKLQFMLWEILDRMPLAGMPRKLKEYFAGTSGMVRIVIIVKLERQPPPKKRKRVLLDNEDEEDDLNLPVQEEDGEPSQEVDQPETREPTPEVDQDDNVPSLPPLPPPVGSLVRGVFWVYGCKSTATPANPNRGEIIAIQKEQEFYPSRPTTSLRLRWTDILSGAEVPPDLVDKAVDIPYAFLHDRFRGLAEVPTLPLAVQCHEGMLFDLEQDILGFSERVPDSGHGPEKLTG